MVNPTPSDQAIEFLNYLGTKSYYPTPKNDEFKTEEFTSASRSCKPFMLFFVGRHGARGLSRAEKIRELTDDTKEFLADSKYSQNYNKLLASFETDISPYSDALTPFGKQQVEKIGEDLYKYHPDFSKKVSLSYTKKNRVQETRDAFLNPWKKNTLMSISDLTNLDQEQSDRALRFFEKCEKYSAQKKELKKEAKRVCAPLLDEINFSDWPLLKEFNSKKVLDKKTLADGMKNIANICAYQLALDITLKDEHFCSLIPFKLLSQYSKYEDCLTQIVKGGPGGLSVLDGLSSNMATAFVENLPEKLETAIEQHANKSTDAPTAFLMFGHAETIIPILTNLGITTDEKNWSGSEVSPMAANFKMIFYDCDSPIPEENLQVYLSLNQTPVKVSGIEQSKLFYSWEKINALLKSISLSTKFDEICFSDDTANKEKSSSEDD